MEKIKFLFISLFYSREKWNDLKVQFINPIVDEIQLRFQASMPIVHISSERGENIGITIPLSNSNSLEIAEFIDTRVKSYFHLHPCKRNRRTSHAVTFFKDFPVNSIQYNLHSFPFKPGDDPNDDLLLAAFQMISRLILEILIDEYFNEESPFTFSFYLHLLLIHAISQDTKPVNTFMDADSSEKIGYNEAFELNRDTLLEITEGIMDDEIYLLDENTWMIEWMQTCIALFHKDSLLSATDGPLSFYKKISACINRQLGLNVASGEMLSGFIRYCLEKRKEMIFDK